MSGYTKLNLKNSIEDQAPKFGMSPQLEFRVARDALQTEASAVSYLKVAPGFRLPFGHSHRQQEEIYVLVGGGARLKLDDEIVELEEWDAVRVPPGTWRGYEGGPEGLELLVFGAPSLGENPRGDVVGERDWWAN